MKSLFILLILMTTKVNAEEYFISCNSFEVNSYLTFYLTTKTDKINLDEVSPNSKELEVSFSCVSGPSFCDKKSTHQMLRRGSNPSMHKSYDLLLTGSNGKFELTINRYFENHSTAEYLNGNYGMENYLYVGGPGIYQATLITAHKNESIKTLLLCSSTEAI